MKISTNTLLLCLCILSVQQVRAWSLKVKNATGGELVLNSSYMACGDLERIISPYKEGDKPFELDNGGCCLTKVDVRSTTGAGRGLKMTYFPPTTGLGSSCRNNEVTFKLTNDQKQIVYEHGVSQAAPVSPALSNFHIFNATNSQLVVMLKYTVAAACMPETRLIEPAQRLDLQVGLCCLGLISIQARGGLADGKKYELRSVGGPTGCGTMVTHTIKTDGMNNLVVESR